MRFDQRAFRVLFVPLLLTSVVAAWLFRQEGQTWITARGIRLDFASCVLLGLFAVIWLAEQVYPARPEWNVGLLAREPGLGRDLVYLFFVTQISSALIALTSAQLKATLVPWEALWPTNVPFVARVALAFFVVEFGSYWLHRAAHHVPLLWQFHSTHHVTTHLTGLKALHTHPVENVCFFVVRTLPLMLVGAGADEVLAATTLGAVLGVLSHANVSLSERGLGLLVNFPSYHAVHHSTDLREGRSNFGCHTVLFDRLFGTFRSAPAEPLTVGLTRPGPRSLYQSLIAPFHRRVD